MQFLGMSFFYDNNAGVATGAGVIPSSMTVINQSRADATAAYLQPARQRRNLHILPGSRVTRLLHDSRITGVEVGNFLQLKPRGYVTDRAIQQFSANSSATSMVVLCRKEVILAAGAIFSPILLQISGIGPRNLLESLGVDVLVDLPGVGRNFQDHPMVQVNYPCKENLFHRHFTLDHSSQSDAEPLQTNHHQYFQH